MILKTYILAHDTARAGCSQYAHQAPVGTVVQFREPVKSREQEEKYHAIIGEIAESELLHGQKLPPESWKRLLIDAFKHDTQHDPELAPHWQRSGSMSLLPALNHPGFVAVGEQSRRFSKRLASAFVEWLLAFQAGAR